MHVNDLLEFETIGDPSEGTAVVDEAPAGADVTPAPSAAEPPVTEAPTGTPAAPQIDFSDPQVQEQLAGLVNQQLAPLLQALTPQPEAPPVPEPWSDTFQEDLARYNAWERQEYERDFLARYGSALEAAQTQQVTQWVDQQLGEVMQSYPDVSGDAEVDRQAVLYAAAGFRQITGDDSRALREAATFQQARDQKIYDKGREDYKASLAGGGNQLRDPGAGGAAVDIEPRAGSFDDVLNRWETITTA